MKIKQISSSDLTLSAQDITTLTSIEPHLIFIFASIRHFEQSTTLKQLIEMLSPATIIGCSTAGEIHQHGVLDHGIVITAIHFKHPDFILAQTTLDSMSDSYDAGHRLAAQLQKNAPKNVLVFGQGVDINGSALIEGLKDHLPQQTIISGGLAGDNGQFNQTFVLNGEHSSTDDILALGFYGSHLKLTSASFGGWKGFGTTRQITRHEDNILYELDHKPALELYKRYLGDYAADLPASGLLFPFSMLTAEGSELGIIRTILGINENASQEEIKKAYRGLQMKWHPDKNPGSQEAINMTQKLNEAYETLGDENKRQEYDMMTHSVCEGYVRSVVFFLV